MPDTIGQLQSFLDANRQRVLVTVAQAKGSTPRGAGTQMLVGETGIFQSIGGGRLEQMGIEHARAMIGSNKFDSRLEIPLGPEIGQCCGGFVQLEFRMLDKRAVSGFVAALEKAQQDNPEVYVFGAGHVGAALAEALALLPVRVVMVDSRQQQIDQLATQAKHFRGQFESHLLAMPESIVPDARPGSAFVIVTHDHAQDFIIAQAALRRTDAAYVGMIGSATKREALRRWLEKNGSDLSRFGKLACPIGANRTEDKRPEIIAAQIAAEVTNSLFTEQEKSRSSGNKSQKQGFAE